MIKFNVALINICTEVEGPFKRLCIWFQGCNRNCKGCCNKALQPLKPANIISLEDLLEIIRKSKIENKIEGITLTGGEPLLQIDLVKLLEEVKSLGLGIILFTGYQLNEIEDNLKSQCDIIIDGYFDEQKIDNNRALVGSLNQNINYISDRYTNEKDWFYKKKNLIEEINVGNDIIFNGDKL